MRKCLYDLGVVTLFFLGVGQVVLSSLIVSQEGQREDSSIGYLRDFLIGLLLLRVKMHCKLK